MAEGAGGAVGVQGRDGEVSGEVSSDLVDSESFTLVIVELLGDDHEMI